MKKLFLLFVMIVAGLMASDSAMAQKQTMPVTDTEKHIKKEVQYAILLMDNGMVKESIHFLDSMNVVHPDNYLIMFELGYAYMLDKDYKKSLKIYKYMCDKLPDADAQTYQMLGTLYDYNGDAKKSVEAYKKGLKKFPNSGLIYCELGIMSLKENDYNSALDYFEKGIAVEPDYSPNYYRAAQLLMGSNQRAWGMIYAETMALMPSREGRKEEVMKMMTDVINEKITHRGDTVHIAFNKVNVVDTYADAIAGLYEVGYYKAATIKKQSDRFSIKELIEMRSGLMEVAQTLDGVVYLLDYLCKVNDAGHWEAYNYWLFYEVNPEEANAWYEENSNKIDAFASWYEENPFLPSTEHRMSRLQFLQTVENKE